MGRTIPHRFFMSMTFLMICSAPAFGAPGDLDPAFGTGGILRLELDDFSNARTVTELPSERILFGGGIGGTGEDGTRDFLLARVLTTGELDTAFDADGFVADSIFDTGPDQIFRLLVQPDGKILIIGIGLNGTTPEGVVARYNPDGTRDAGFGADGTIRPAPGFAIALDLDGNVLVGGDATSSEFSITRFTGAGVLDTGFGSGGTLTETISPAGTVDLATLDVDAEGRIVVGVKADDVVAVARYFADGSPDSGFGGGDGFVFNFCDNEDAPTDLAFQSDGKIVVAVRTGNGVTDKTCLLRFTADGEVDNTFDGDGKVLSDIPDATKESPTAIDVMKDDRIVVGGGVDAAPADSAFFAARYEANGTPDATFGGDGFVVFNVTPGEIDIGSDVIVLSDGRVLVSGSVIREAGSPFFDATLIVLEGDATDLSLTKTADRTEATAGDGIPVVFTIEVSNNGPLAAHGVTLTDSVPAALTVSSAETDNGSCGGGQNIVCDLGVLDPGEGATITVTTTAAAAGSVTNTVGVAGQIGDSNPSDNAASVTVTLAAPPGGGTGGNGGGCQLVHRNSYQLGNN